MKNPLSDFLRPKQFKDVVGQDHIIDWLKNRINAKKPLSTLLFGPPGSGKTTIARIYASSFGLNFKTISAVFSSVSDLKKIINETKQSPLFNKQIILFVDEIHRFNKAQQDAFLPFIEDGTIILIGATTENPSFSLNNALLSRLRVLTLNTLKTQDLSKIIDTYESKIKKLKLTKEAKASLINLSSGDARYLLNLIENIEEATENSIDLETLEKYTQKKPTLYDKDRDYHYNLISALHKSIRGSDPDASLYWLSRMLEAKEDPLFILRRFIRIALEDIGLADPEALNMAISAYNTFKMLGSPEGEIALAQICIYLALCPKSNSVYMAFEKAKELASKTSNLSPPLHILNAPTQLMKNQGYSKGYIYDHNTKDGFSGQNYFPENIEKLRFYYPKERGFERDMNKRLVYFQKLRELIPN